MVVVDVVDDVDDAIVQYQQQIHVVVDVDRHAIRAEMTLEHQQPHANY